eukprot:803452-Rhodomonas_salina.1
MPSRNQRHEIPFAVQSVGRSCLLAFDSGVSCRSAQVERSASHGSSRANLSFSFFFSWCCPMTLRARFLPFQMLSVTPR